VSPAIPGRWNFRAVFSGGGGIYFYPNGRLKKANLAKAFEIEGRKLTKGTLVEFDPQGRLILPSE